MKYWYVAFVLVISWFILNVFNNGSVTRYELTAYAQDGKVIDSMIVEQSSMSQPESLPVPKSYMPVKPVKFLP